MGGHTRWESLKKLDVHKQNCALESPHSRISQIRNLQSPKENTLECHSHPWMSWGTAGSSALPEYQRCISVPAAGIETACTSPTHPATRYRAPLSSVIAGKKRQCASWQGWSGLRRVFQKLHRGIDLARPLRNIFFPTFRLLIKVKAVKLGLSPVTPPEVYVNLSPIDREDRCTLPSPRFRTRETIEHESRRKIGSNPRDWMTC